MNTALQSTDLTKLGIGVIIALVVIGILLSLLITAIVGRIIIAVIVIAAGIWVWQQRTSIKDDINDCHLGKSYSFFGITVDVPKSVRQHCTSKGS